MMTGEDLSVIFDGKRPAPRPHFTSCYDDHVLAGDYDWFFISDSEGKRKRLYDKRKDPEQEPDVARGASGARGQVLAHPRRTRPAARCRSSAARRGKPVLGG